MAVATTRAEMSPAPPVAAWRHALVYGLGASGTAAARVLADRGVRVTAIDARPADELGSSVRALLESGGIERLLAESDCGLPTEFDAVVLSPGVPPDRPLLRAARAAGVSILAEVELAWQLLASSSPPSVVAVTGSNGKSTTTALTGALLEAAGFRVEVCGNIGRPLSDCIDGPAGRLFVVELSSFQLEATDRFRPRASALLNISPDHLDRYDGVAAYAAAKARIFENQMAGDVAVVNGDDREACRLMDAEGASRTVRRRLFSRSRKVDDGCYLDDGRIIEVGPDVCRELFHVDDLALDGVHNVENAMAAALLASAMGSEPGSFLRGLRAFRGLPHRLRLVGTTAGVEYYDDSKATNPAATVKALAAFDDGSVHLILGGRAKGDTDRFAELSALAATKAAVVYLIGESSAAIESALPAGLERRRCDSLERAVEASAAAATSGQTVLLSPACASFDQFEDFAHRGRCFERIVRGLAATPAAEERGGDG